MSNQPSTGLKPVAKRDLCSRQSSSASTSATGVSYRACHQLMEMPSTFAAATAETYRNYLLRIVLRLEIRHHLHRLTAASIVRSTCP